MSGSSGKCRVCGNRASVSYPLLAGSPAFCSQHHNPKDAGPFGCDFSGPDDFDIPFDDVLFHNPFAEHPWTKPRSAYSRRKFVWTDINGDKHKLKDIDDRYLQNIINFLKRQDGVFLLAGIIAFLEDEQRIRVGAGG